ncbi:Sua5 YciO YrdC YwlC family protein [Campylobacter sp. RM13119]|uniref:Sua5 YciO YrdC YwlC family protein n=1 Tax=Campylobacter TaxID=194 RepID=UPI001472B920|nr:Sua5 YciO YrdC YwlC family protein [Campylobacter sp. RM13119]MBE3022973.1 Sua5 YciO YrdC YwlC family protein [Campylobacter sp. 7477a]MBE3606425.1 Sua5 YciO YrdC YwlC family protein [Campylobacter sp. RM13119]
MIYLAQTDTTAGFLSKDYRELNRVKERKLDQPCLIATAKFATLQNLTRVPNKFKNMVRRSKKTTFLYPNLKAIRVVKDGEHAKFLDMHSWLYSTSANRHGENFDEIWARNVADIVVDERFYQTKGSKIYKISKTNIKRIR